jgi:hypothetical protein
MKNIFKSIFALGAAMIFAVSCNVDNIGTLYEHEGSDKGVSFVQSVLSDTEISAATSSIVLTVGRAVTDAAQTVNIASTLNGIGVPSSVSFAAGEGSADLVLDLSSMSVGKSYKGKISLANESDYNDLSISEVSVTLQKAYSWSSYGKVKITDDLVCDVFGTDNVTWAVQADKADGFEVYRLLDPYGPTFPYNDPGDYTLGAKWVLDCTNPNAVTFERTYLGFDWGYGEFNVYLLEGGEGKMVNKVITFPANGMVFNLPDYGSFYGNPNGLLAIDLNL